MTVRVVHPVGDGDRQWPEAPVAALVGDVTSWLRDLVWALGPVAPAVGVANTSAVSLSATSGGVAVAEVVIANHQQASTAIALWPSVLYSDHGDAWFPEVVGRAGVVVGAGEERAVSVAIGVPHHLPSGCYRGTLVGLAVEGAPPALVIDVTGPA